MTGLHKRALTKGNLFLFFSCQCLPDNHCEDISSGFRIELEYGISGLQRWMSGRIEGWMTEWIG